VDGPSGLKNANDQIRHLHYSVWLPLPLLRHPLPPLLLLHDGVADDGGNSRRGAKDNRKLPREEVVVD